VNRRSSWLTGKPLLNNRPVFAHERINLLIEPPISVATQLSVKTDGRANEIRKMLRKSICVVRRKSAISINKPGEV
jgi:hypothetical protein